MGYLTKHSTILEPQNPPIKFFLTLTNIYFQALKLWNIRSCSMSTFCDPCRWSYYILNSLHLLLSARHSFEQSSRSPRPFPQLPHCSCRHFPWSTAASSLCSSRQHQGSRTAEADLETNPRAAARGRCSRSCSDGAAVTAGAWSRGARCCWRSGSAGALSSPGWSSSSSLDPHSQTPVHQLHGCSRPTWPQLWQLPSVLWKQLLLS